MGSGGAAQLLRYIGRTTFATYGVFDLCCFHDLKKQIHTDETLRPYALLAAPDMDRACSGGTEKHPLLLLSFK